MSWPEAEVTLDEDVVRHLLQAQHPDLAGLPLHLFDAGFDNVMWRLGDELAVRMPRREVAASLIELEQRWLPGLVPLPLEVPVPLRLGRPGAGYPWHWSVVPWIEGEPGDRAAITDPALSAQRLGGFLRVLHRAAPPGAPHNPWRSGPLDTRADTFELRLKELDAYVDGPALRRIWDDALGADHHRGPLVWCHGDLHPANTLIRDGAVAAVIDFGDMCAADPAVDIGAAWMSIPDSSLGSFWAAYGTPDPDLVRRGRGWAVLFSLMLLQIGLEGHTSYANVGRITLARIVGGAPG